MGVSHGNTGELTSEEAVVSAESGPARGRKAYQRPAFRYERVFETMALSCGKLSPTQFQCHFHSKTS